MLKKRNYKTISYQILAVVFFAIASFFACKQKETTTLRNGYEYQIIESKGGTTPRPDQIVTLDLQLIDDFDNVLDDSRDAEIRPSIRVPSVRSAKTDSNPLLALIELMGVGDSAVVTVPIDSLPNPPQEFRQSKTIDYHIKILHIENEKAHIARMNKENPVNNPGFIAKVEEKKKEAEEAIEAYKTKKLKGRKINIEGGLVVQLVNETKGEKGLAGEKVDVNYFGFLKDGTSFDNSYRTGRPYTLQLGSRGSIEGWLKGIPEVPEGSSAILDIPPSMGYGQRGSPPAIPPNADLLFYVTVENILKNQ